MDNINIQGTKSLLELALECKRAHRNNNLSNDVFLRQKCEVVVAYLHKRITSTQLAVAFSLERGRSSPTTYISAILRAGIEAGILSLEINAKET